MTLRPVGTDHGYANARAATIEETIYRLEEEEF
jgi:hypothetical protein